MSVVIFGVGVLVFFLTVYGTVVAGGIRLTKEQLSTSPDLAPELAGDPGHEGDEASTSDVIRADF